MTTGPGSAPRFELVPLIRPVPVLGGEEDLIFRTCRVVPEATALGSGPVKFRIRRRAREAMLEHEQSARKRPEERTAMNIHFNHTEPVEAPAEVLFGVITDYTNYPSFNSALIKVEVVTKDESGAEFLADRKTKIGKQVRAFDRYEVNGNLVVERTYDGNESARSTWTVHPVDDSHCTLTIDAAQSMGPVRGLAMKPALKHLFYGINFTPFIDEAERRAKL
jgi:ribosome-associated toxin RatA of RatAB toxin-antitoxin module